MKRRIVALVLGLTAALGAVAGVATVSDGPDTAVTVAAGSSWS